MIEFLLAVTLECSRVKEVISHVRANDSLPAAIKEEIIMELLEVAPPGCQDLNTELGR